MIGHHDCHEVSLIEVNRYWRVPVNSYSYPPVTAWDKAITEELLQGDRKKIEPCILQARWNEVFRVY